MLGNSSNLKRTSKRLHSIHIKNLETMVLCPRRKPNHVLLISIMIIVKINKMMKSLREPQIFEGVHKFVLVLTLILTKMQLRVVLAGNNKH